MIPSSPASLQQRRSPPSSAQKALKSHTRVQPTFETGPGGALRCPWTQPHGRLRGGSAGVRQPVAAAVRRAGATGRRLPVPPPGEHDDDLPGGVCAEGRGAGGECRLVCEIYDTLVRLGNKSKVTSHRSVARATSRVRCLPWGSSAQFKSRCGDAYELPQRIALSTRHLGYIGRMVK